MGHKFKWKINNAIIECDQFDDREVIILLKNGKIHHTDGAISIFDNLVLPSNQLEPIVEGENQQKIGGRGRRKGGATL
jgi:hypothetical protein